MLQDPAAPDQDKNAEQVPLQLHYTDHRQLLTEQRQVRFPLQQPAEIELAEDDGSDHRQGHGNQQPGIGLPYPVAYQQEAIK